PAARAATNIAGNCARIAAFEGVLMPELAALCAWARDFLPAGVFADADVDSVPITGDAAFRRYYRLDIRPPPTALIAPPDRENSPAFVAKGLALARAGVHVPAIHAVDFQRGFLLLEDLGDRLFLPLLDGDSVASLY